MTQNSISRTNHLRLLPWLRAQAAKAVALAVLATPLPAYAQGPDVVAATIYESSKSQSENSNLPPVAVTDYVDMMTATRGFNMLSNDTDRNQDTLHVIDAWAKNDAIAYTTDGLVADAASASQPQTDEVEYILSDGRGGSAKGKVMISAR